MNKQSALETVIEFMCRYGTPNRRTADKAAAELARLKRIEAAARKIDWEIVADRVENPGDYIGDERTANLIRKLAAALKGEPK